jgi:ribosomal protein L11 methyltransferase
MMNASCWTSYPYAAHRVADHAIPKLRVVHVEQYYHESLKTDTIYLGPGHGFGSGRHPTTAMCLEVLERLLSDYKPDKVLDAGTGNGILAIAAVRLGADHVLGVEKIREDVETARCNLLLNLVQSKVYILHGDVSNLDGTYDLIIANLCPDQIVVLAQVLEERLAEGGYLVLSGLRGFEKDRALMLLTDQRGLVLVEDLWDQAWSTFLMWKASRKI